MALCVFSSFTLSPILKTLNITSTDKETWGTKKFRKLPRVTELISSQSKTCTTFKNYKDPNL